MSLHATCTILFFKEIHTNLLQLTANHCNALYYQGAVPEGMKALCEFTFELCQTGLSQDLDHCTATHCKTQAH
jgi:hypothetical protein